MKTAGTGQGDIYGAENDRLAPLESDGVHGYPELAVSSPATTATIATTQCANPRGMARPSRPKCVMKGMG